MAKAAWIAQQTDARFVRELFPVRKRDTHKGDYGKVLLLCGSEGLTGAARLAAKAALRTGSGLVYLGVPEKIYPRRAVRSSFRSRATGKDGSALPRSSRSARAWRRWTPCSWGPASAGRRS